MGSTWRNTALSVLGAVIACLALGAWWGRGTADPKAATVGRRILYYHDPMHPAYRSDRTGIAPDCGMQLEPVYADGPASAASSVAPPWAPGAVQVDADKQQLIGVRIEEVRKAPTEHDIRILGRVVAEDNRLYRVIAPADGMIRDITAVTTGSRVEKDQALASYFSRDSLSLRDQQSYVGMLSSVGQPNDPTLATAALRERSTFLEFARDSLKLSGMGDPQLRDFESTRKLTTTIRITSPVKGIVLVRNVYPDQRFDKGSELYRIADLSAVWILADVFENDARLLPFAAGATVRYLGRDWPVRISGEPPQFDPGTRTLKLRLELANPGSLLRPDMFVDVELKVNVPSAITAPAEAVIDSGLRKTVFVERGGGYFEPRQVETGARLGDRIIVAGGLKPGERIVVSGNFLLDSESRLRLGAAATTPATATDPTCGMRVDPSRPGGWKAEILGRTYYFCSESCKTKFEKAPETFLKAGLE